jgi:N-acyl-D-amino-acid deacylase
MIKNPVLELPDRGLLVRGYKADIAIFDADNVQDQATYADARRYATGVQYVLVNGDVSVAGGDFTGVRAGNLLLKRRAD